MVFPLSSVAISVMARARRPAVSEISVLVSDKAVKANLRTVQPSQAKKKLVEKPAQASSERVYPFTILSMPLTGPPDEGDSALSHHRLSSPCLQAHGITRAFLLFFYIEQL